MIKKKNTLLNIKSYIINNINNINIKKRQKKKKKKKLYFLI